MQCRKTRAQWRSYNQQWLIEDIESKHTIQATPIRERFEDTKGAIRNRISEKDIQYNGQKKDRQYNGQKKDRQYNGQKKDIQYNGRKKKDKKTNNDLQNITQKTKDWTTRVNLNKNLSLTKSWCQPLSLWTEETVYIILQRVTSSSCLYVNCL